jgi:putative peptidoglycan binding protein
MGLKKIISKRLVGAGCVVAMACLMAAGQNSSSASGSETTGTSSASTKSSSKAHKSKHTKKTKSKRGQQKIDSERARQIQEALIREHYMDGEATGTWNATTESALRKYQADNGWQNKTVPDSRALIKLGLGPSHDHLLNPESAMTTTPQAARASGSTASRIRLSNKRNENLKGVAY